MRIHRGYLFWGIVFVLLGAIPLADREGWVDAQKLNEIWRLWPLIIIAIGFAIIVARTRASILGTVAAALVVGVMGGGLLAYGGGWAFEFGDCAPGNTSQLQHTSREGTFTGDASAELTLSCGTLDVGMVEGTGWTLQADYRGSPPIVDVTPDRLSVRQAQTGARRQEWDVSLPIGSTQRVSVTANAAQATLDVTNATLDELDLDINAGDLVLVATGASIGSLDLGVNAGRARVTLGGPTTGDLEVNAGTIAVCVPTDASVTIELNDQFALGTNLADQGLTQNGDTWTRPGTGAAIRLDVQGNAATFDLDPSGGCR